MRFHLSIEKQREYDEAAVKANMEAKKAQKKTLACGCPGSQSKSINREVSNSMSISNDIVEIKGSQLNQWPVQIKLVPTNASYLKNASLLIAKRLYSVCIWKFS